MESLSLYEDRINQTMKAYELLSNAAANEVKRAVELFKHSDVRPLRSEKYAISEAVKSAEENYDLLEGKLAGLVTDLKKNQQSMEPTAGTNDLYPGRTMGSKSIECPLAERYILQLIIGRAVLYGLKNVGRFKKAKKPSDDLTLPSVFDSAKHFIENRMFKFSDIDSCVERIVKSGGYDMALLLLDYARREFPPVNIKVEILEQMSVITDSI